MSVLRIGAPGKTQMYEPVEETYRVSRSQWIRCRLQWLMRSQRAILSVRQTNFGNYQFLLTVFLSEQASGPFGLARVKNYDRRFAFYPGFSVERSLALEFRAEGISRLSKEIQALREGLEAGEEGKPSKQPLTGSAEKLAALMSRLAESMAQYGKSTTARSNNRPHD